MSLYIRVLRYLLPSKGKIVLVVVVSIMTSLLGVVSIYSVLPLLNAVFTADSALVAPAHPGSVALQKQGKDESQKLSVQSSPDALKGFDTEKIKASVTSAFEMRLLPKQKSRHCFNICLFSDCIVCGQESFCLSERADHFQDTDQNSQETPG